MQPTSRDDFTIAIICALPLEADPVQALFDEHYDSLGKRYGKERGDDNAYINGRIGKHKIVVSYVPGMGKGSAASVASSLKISYRNIEVAFVIGICGGAPYTSSDDEVFLGDVIISENAIQYDFGRQYPGGFEKKTGVMNTLGKPNRTIRGILEALKGRNLGNALHERLKANLQALQESHPDWRYPTTVDDILFETRYQHKHYKPTSATCICLDEVSENICEAAINSGCALLGCDLDRVRRRRCSTEHNSPRVHIGTVASADTVMKSGEHRDRLVQSDNVIGFEMEGAGVWDNMPCIIIKGVCDYADSHKNKSWQAYAAGTAAATFKCFLEYWVPSIRQEDNPFHVPLDLSAIPTVEQFVGREVDLNCLWEYLQPQSPERRRVAVLHGLGGIGKTQLAVQFARKHKNDFTAVFWLSGRTKSILESSLSSCLCQIERQPEGDGRNDQTEILKRANRVLQWLANPSNTRWLIIFDNIDQYSSGETNNDTFDICQFFPTADHGSIIITSRLLSVTDVGRSFPVSKLDEGDAIQLLLQSSGLSDRDITEDKTKKDLSILANKLDGLSLAIIIAGAYIRQTKISITSYLGFYTAEWSDLQLRSQATRPYEQENILRTWCISYEEIQRRNPTTSDLLLFLACFDNRDIWYELVKCSLKCSRVPPCCEKTLQTKLDFLTAIQTLTEFSLVDAGQKEESYMIHPVVQEWCLHITTPEDHKSLLYEVAIVSVGLMTPSPNDRDYAEIQQRLLPHADYLIQREQFMWSDNRDAMLGGLQNLAQLYANHGRFQKALRLYYRALRYYETVLGPQDEATVTIARSLGILYIRQGRAEMAESVLTKVLLLNIFRYGQDSLETVELYNDFGALYQLQGRIREADIAHSQALSGFEKLKGPNDLSTLDVVNNLGILYSTQGKLDEAEQMYQRALAGRERILGADHMTTLEIVVNLAILYSKQGREDDEEKMYRRALAGREKALGSDHPLTLDIVHNLGVCYENKGWFDKAEEMHTRQLEGREKSLGRGHMSTINSANQLGVIYCYQGKLSKAKEMIEQALLTARTELGPEHPTTSMVGYNVELLSRFVTEQGEVHSMDRSTLATHRLTANTGEASLPERLRKRDRLRAIFRGK